MISYIKFLFDNIRVNRIIIVSPDSDVAVLPLYKNVTKITFLDALWFKTGTVNDHRYISKHVLSSKLRLPICCLLPAMHTGCNSVNSFSHIRKLTIFQTLKNKIEVLTNMIDFGDLFRKSACCYFNSMCMLSLWRKYFRLSVNDLRYRMFTDKNLSGDRWPSTLYALVLYLRKALIFFLNSFTLFIKNIKCNIDKTFS